MAEDVTVLLGPGLNIKRHPLCGRNFEYFSEDPLLSGKFAAALVKGVQSRGVGTSIKHFAVNNQEHARMFIDAIVDERTLREIYLRGFEIAVRESQPWTVMCAYNRLNGEYCSEHNWLLNRILRDEWGFEGLVVTDWGATNDRVKGIGSGLDLEMPGSGGINDALVLDAVNNGYLKESVLDQAVERNVALSLLGQDLHDRQTPADHPGHHQLAQRAAEQSAVLLKNEDKVLPLNASANLAIIGAFAKRPRYQGTGSSQVNPTQLDNAWDALNQILPAEQLRYAPGYDPKTSVDDFRLIDEAVACAQEADAVVLFAGLPTIFESEGFDRSHMDLPAQHNKLISAVCAANPNTIVVLQNGSPVRIPWIREPKAIIEAYLGGQGGGGAIANLLFGIANPSGKLAETFALAQSDIPADKNFPGKNRQVHYREGLYVGYRYFDSADKPVLFPFGHGLSYTTFSYAAPNPSGTVFTQGGSLSISVDITNSGEHAGAEVVQLYVKALRSEVYRPSHELKAFAKIHLAAGATGTVTLNIDDTSFMYFDQGNRDWVVEPGQYELQIGASSRDIRQKLVLDVVSAHQPSRVAKDVGDPLADNIFHVSDYTFAKMLNRPVPEPESSRPFHENSSLAEVGETWLGAKFKAKVAAGFQASMGGNSKDETLNKMFEEMANNMPLRGLALFSGGKTSMQDIRLMLALLNHRYIEALKLWWQMRQAS
ncbi:MAG: glycoside hydrolase family 3 C-terminal domain-containing protein [bacterium]